MTITAVTPAPADVTPDPDSARYDDAALILKLAKITPGLPFPHVSEYRASFHFTNDRSREQVTRAVETAEAVLAREFGVEFKTDCTKFGSMRHRIRWAELPSGVVLSLVASAIHFDDQDTSDDAPVREMAGSAA